MEAKPILYSTNCPKCNVLHKKLTNAGLDFEVTNDIEELMNMGITAAPVLKVDDEYLNFMEAVKWVNAHGEVNAD